MTKYLVVAMISAIIIAHIILWRADIATGLKLTFTVINATDWAIILGLIFFIDRWLEAIKRRNTNDHDNVT